MKTFIVYRTKAKEIVEEWEKTNYREAHLPQFEGVVFHDGTCAIRWYTETRSTSLWDSFEAMKSVHISAHPDYGTRVEWSDGEIQEL